MVNTACAQLLPSHWTWKKSALAALLGSLLLGVGLMAGYFAGDAVATNEAAAAQRAARSFKLSSRGTPQQLQQLPELGSEAAAALLADPGTPGGHCHKNTQYHSRVGRAGRLRSVLNVLSYFT
jgi:hypothetical protein